MDRIGSRSEAHGRRGDSPVVTEVSTQSGERIAPAETLDQMFARAQHLQRAGHLQEADALYQAILDAHGTHFGSLLHLGVLRLHQGNAREALRLIRAALTQDPGSAQAHANLAVALQASSPDEAIDAYRAALSLDSTLVAASCGLATALQAQGRLEEAAVQYRAALALRPDFAEASYGLGTALQALKRFEAAIDAYRAALAIDPDYAEASCALGGLLRLRGRHVEAIRHYENALDVDPRYIEANTGLAGALYALNRHQEAIQRCRKALEADPGHAEAHDTLGNALCALERYQEGIGHYAEAMRLKPALLSAVRCASAHRALNQQRKAIALCEQALAIAPDSVAAHNVLGELLAEVGRLDESRRVLERAIMIAPRVPRLYLNLFTVSKVRPSDPYLGRLETMARAPEALPQEERLALEFALAKAYSDLGQHERAFRHLLAGNTLKRRSVSYDEAATIRWFESVRKGLNAHVVRQRRGLGDPSDVPIFIVGMMRSGSTLVEQILASHPKVHAGGERKDFGKAMHRLLGEGREMAAAYGTASILSGDRLRRLGAAYIGGLKAEAPQAERITDKMPANFHVLGLIHLALPNARIIHTRRDPIDTCLSCFSQLFTAEHNFTYDLGELGRFYRAYRKMMEHWRDVLPPGVMLEVDYEELVGDFDTQAQRIVAHCGLEWDEACRSFYQNERPVRTASVAQVRQPIYRSSVGRWRPSDELLRPLLEGLDPVSL